MNKKIFLSVVLILSLVLSMASVSFAEDTFKLNIRADEWKQDEAGVMIVETYISLENNPGLAALGFGIKYDQDILEPVSVEKLEVLEAGKPQHNIPNCVARKDDTLKISLFNGGDQYGDGDIYKVIFKISKYASAADSEKVTDITLVENSAGRFYTETWEEYVPVFGTTKVTIPVIEGEGEEFVPVEPGDSEGEAFDPDDYNDIINSITGPSDSANIPTPNRHKTTIVLTIDSVEIKVNDNTLINDVAPIIVNDRTMLPVRIIAQELGVTSENIIWDEKAQKVTIITDEKKIEIYIDSSKAYVNGATVELDSPAFIQNDRTYLPLRFISENLGASVDWDEDLQQVTIKK